MAPSEVSAVTAVEIPTQQATDSSSKDSAVGSISEQTATGANTRTHARMATHRMMTPLALASATEDIIVNALSEVWIDTES
jgi:hypothetical protein